MKTKLLLTFVMLFSLAFSCSEPEAVTQDCNCEKKFYKYDIIGWQNQVQPIWGYKYQYSEPTSAGCSDASVDYIQVAGTNNMYYKIECE